MSSQPVLLDTALARELRDFFNPRDIAGYEIIVRAHDFLMFETQYPLILYVPDHRRFHDIPDFIPQDLFQDSPVECTLKSNEDRLESYFVDAVNVQLRRMSFRFSLPATNEELLASIHLSVVNTPADLEDQFISLVVQDPTRKWKSTIRSMPIKEVYALGSIQQIWERSKNPHRIDFRQFT